MNAPRRSLRPVKTTEVRDWTAQLAAGVSIGTIARNAGRCASAVAYHVDPGSIAGRRHRALRDERLFASCNRALAEAAR